MRPAGEYRRAAHDAEPRSGAGRCPGSVGADRRTGRRGLGVRDLTPRRPARLAPRRRGHVRGPGPCPPRLPATGPPRRRCRRVRRRRSWSSSRRGRGARRGAPRAVAGLRQPRGRWGRAQLCVEPGDPLRRWPAAGWESASHWLLGPVADELPTAWAASPPPMPRRARLAGPPPQLPRGGVVTARRRAPSPLARAGRTSWSSVAWTWTPTRTCRALGAFLRPGAALVVTDGAAGGQRLASRGGEASIVAPLPGHPDRDGR